MAPAAILDFCTDSNNWTTD